MSTVVQKLRTRSRFVNIPSREMLTSAATGTFCTGGNSVPSLTCNSTGTFCTGGNASGLYATTHTEPTTQSILGGCSCSMSSSLHLLVSPGSPGETRLEGLPPLSPAEASSSGGALLALFSSVAGLIQSRLNEATCDQTR